MKPTLPPLRQVSGTVVLYYARAPTLEVNMLTWSIIFLIVALIAAAVGFTGVAGAAAGMAKILFVVFLVIFLVSLFF